MGYEIIKHIFTGSVMCFVPVLLFSVRVRHYKVTFPSTTLGQTGLFSFSADIAANVYIEKSLVGNFYTRSLQQLYYQKKKKKILPKGLFIYCSKTSFDCCSTICTNKIYFVTNCIAFLSSHCWVSLGGCFDCYVRCEKEKKKINE